MVDAVEKQVEGYEPDMGFEQDSRAPLVDLTLSDSTELWLLQWPLHELPDFHGKELSLSLDGDGCLGSFEGSSGKLYDVVSCSAQEPDATVFLSSQLETKIVGKISRRVSLVHYPEPKELEKQEAEKISKRLRQMPGGSSLMHRSGTTTTSSMVKNSQLSRGHTASTHSSRHKSSLSEVGERSNAKKHKRMHGLSGSTDRSTQDSGKGHSGRTYLGSSGK